jgi:hypothetical protein
VAANALKNLSAAALAHERLSDAQHGQYSIHAFTDEISPMQMTDEFDEFAWIEDQERGVRQSIQNLHAEIEAYQRQLTALREQRVRAGLLPSPKATLAHLR